MISISLGSLISRRSRSSRLRVVDSNRSSVNLRIVLLNSLGRRFEIGKSDKTEATRSTRVLVHHDFGAGDFSTRFEFRLKPVVVYVPRELTDKDGSGGFVFTVGLDLCLFSGSFSLVVGFSLASWDVSALLYV